MAVKVHNNIEVRVEGRHENEELRIKFEIFSGKEWIDLRQWFLPEEHDPLEADPWRPTGKGMKITPAMVPDLIEGLQAVQRDLIKSGKLKRPGESDDNTAS